MTEMIRLTALEIKSLPALEFPFKKSPAIWAPERTILRLGDGKRVPIFTWMYLERCVVGSTNRYNRASLSTIRVSALPQIIQRLSDDFRLRALSPASIYAELSSFARFLVWTDSEEHGGIFEPILSEPELTLNALEVYHRYLKGQIQSRAFGRTTAANQETATLNALSAIHNRKYSDEIEKISGGPSRTTPAPKGDDVAQFMSTLTAIFDSACRILESCTDLHSDGTWRLSVSAIDDSQVVNLKKGFSRIRLMELAAMSYVGLVFGDSGANLAQVKILEEPEDFFMQLDDPERISLTLKVVKLRAGGKLVPITMTAVTFTRLRRFAEIRHQVIELLGCDDISPFFFKCGYTLVQGGQHEPFAILPIGEFLSELRNKCKAAGVKLPNVTLRQLRVHKQQHLVRNHGLKVAADTMGHTIATAVKAYCAAQEGVQANDIGRFMSSLHKTVIHRANGRSTTLVSVPAGGCVSHGNPEPADPAPLVEPDCGKTEGCFFCEHFRIHADEEDLRKLLSCQSVLLRVGHLQGESVQADRVYESVLGRIEFLLRELQQVLDPDAFKQIEADVAAGNLTRYWAVKVQQLGLLGLIATTAKN